MAIKLIWPHHTELIFFETPASEDEIQIAKLMEKYHKALKTKDLKLLISLFSKEAKIDSMAAGGVVGIKEYQKSMEQNMPHLSGICLADLIIRVEDKNIASIMGLSRYTFRGVPGKVYERLWNVEKHNNEWLIVKSEYLNKK